MPRTRNNAPLPIDVSELTGRIVVAVSGGPDSIALLHRLHALGRDVHAAHLDHGLRAGSPQDAAYVARFCAVRAIPATLERIDIAARARESGGVVVGGRGARYAFFEQVADAVGAAWIATGHTLDDQAETVLYNIVRGTGLRGLGGIPRRRGRIVRPMLDVSRAEVERYCAWHELAPRRDPTNESLAYTRGAMRHTVLPLLAERFNPHVKEALARLADSAADESAVARELARRWLDARPDLPLPELADESLAVQRQVLREWLLGQGVRSDDLGFKQVENIRRRIGGRFAAMLHGSWYVSGDGRTLTSRQELSPPATPPRPLVAPVPVLAPGALSLGGYQVSVTYDEGYAGPPLEAREWRNGDKIALPYGHKLVADLMREMAMPIPLRREMPLLAQQGSRVVLALPGGRVAVDAPAGLRFTAERTG